MKLLSLDLEMNQPSGKIIQIGAVVGDSETGAILDSFSVFINPNEELSEYIIGLTGITQKQVDQGDSLMDGYLKLKEFAKKHDCFCNPVTWGGGDSQELKNQLGPVENWLFGRRWIDTKTLYQSYRIANGKKVQAGLAKALLNMGLKFQGRKHDALDDAKNTWIIYKALINKLKE